MYFGTATPSSYSVKVGTIDTLLTINNKDYININNIAFEGANGDAIYALSSDNINIQKLQCKQCRGRRYYYTVVKQFFS